LKGELDDSSLRTRRRPLEQLFDVADQ